jgi:hypothetical protein
MDLIHSIGPRTHVLVRFEPFRYCTKVDAKLAELVPSTHKCAKQSRVRIFRNERRRPLHWTQNSCFRTFRTVSLVHESRYVALESFVTNAPDALHWTENSCFRAFRGVSLLQESRCKTSRSGAINAQVC